MTKQHPFRERLVGRIRYLLELHELSVTSLEQKLGRKRGYLADALRGSKRLPVEIVIEVLEHLGIDPEEFFAGETAEEKRWRLEHSPQVDEVAEDTSPEALLRALLGPGPRVHDLAAVLLSVVQLLEDKDVVTQEELKEELSKGVG